MPASSGDDESRTAVAFVDLDRTLIYSRKSLRVGGSPPVEELVCVEVIDGMPHSYVTATAAAILSRLVRAAVLVPVTTRTLAQVRRLSLPSGLPELVLAANGGRLLRSGREDADHARMIADVLAASSAPWGDVAAHLRRLADEGGESWIRSIKSVEGLFFSIRVHHRTEPPAMPEQVAELECWCQALGWTVFFHGRRLYCLPTTLTKHLAARVTAERLGATVTYAAGDSRLDAGMMAWADHAMRPAHGELEEIGPSLPGVAVTSASGVLAGEEITQWLASRLLRPEP